MAGIGQPDDVLALQLGEGAADRLDGQAQVIGDVGPAHGQRHRAGGQPLLGGAARQLQQEGCHLFLGGLAAQQQHLLLRGHQILHGHGEHLAFQARELVHHGVQLAVGEPAQLGGDQGLGGVAIAAVQPQPEHVAREQKADDLAAAVAHQLVQLHRAGADGIDVVGRVALAEHREGGGQLGMAAHRGQPPDFVVGQVGAERQFAHHVAIAARRRRKVGRVGTLCLVIVEVQGRHEVHRPPRQDWPLGRSRGPASSSSNRIRWAAPSRSSNWPDFKAQRNATNPRPPRTRATGISIKRLVNLFSRATAAGRCQLLPATRWTWQSRRSAGSRNPPPPGAP